MTERVRAARIASPLDRRQVLAGLAGIAALPAGPALAEPRQATSPAGLARGVNLSHWFAQSHSGYGARHLASFVSDDELGRIADAGFSHVRLGIEPSAMFASPGDEIAIAAPVLEALQLAIARIQARGLTIVLDLHPVGPVKRELMNPAGADRLVRSWSLLAGALAPQAGSNLVLEILNEPDPIKGEAWWALQERALAAIRQAGMRGPVIANGGSWSGVDDLVAREPYDDAQVIYTFHHYAPILFTHQATTWSWDVAGRIAGLSWPLAPAAADEASTAAAKDDRDRGILRGQIAGGAFTQDWLEASFARLAKWQNRHRNVPVYVGEFGVYAKSAPVAARLAWMRASREAFERHGWGWAIWDNSASFGFRQAGGSELDPDLLRALGTRAS